MRQRISITKLFLFLIFACISMAGFSQDRCGSVEYMKKLQGENLDRNRVHFEQWLERKIRQQKGASGNRQQAIYQIPVVVHVIHFGEAVGVGRNISDAQIESQIDVLNKDYQRLNTDASQTPAEFQSIAGSVDVEFILARQNPEGLATNGIVRALGSKSSWTINDNYSLKSLSYWPSEDYLNIWVCNLSGLLGYAQFPISNLPGLENSSDNSLTDGVVIAYNAFGSSENAPFPLMANYNRGRTTTHEVAHFFGLRHTWGDDEGDCAGSDYVNDTPNQGGSSSGCPMHPQTTCGETTMFQNYMDYTDDGCMNLFTQGQTDRMIAVLENSPRRASLLSSHGLDDPAPLANDLGIKEIISPLEGSCDQNLSPAIEVRNYGSNNITTAQISVRGDGTILETLTFTFAPLLPLQSATVAFSAASFTSGVHTLTFEILNTNGTADGRTSNNISEKSVVIPESIAVPFTETFNAFPSTWQILNPDLKTTWQLAATPDDDPDNKSMKMDFYNYEDNLGEIDLLVTPVFDLTSAPVAVLLFDVAYARFQNDNDGLKVVVLSNCNTDITQGTVVYDKAGSNLQTTNATTNEFTPTTPAQWRNEFIDLSNFVGQSNIQVAFVGINDWGNNLYLDNVSLTISELNDLALSESISPPPVICTNEVTPKIRIRNEGTLVSSFKIRVIVNSIVAYTQTFSGLSFLGDTELEVDLPAITLSRPENTILYEVFDPGGLPDINAVNNALTTYVIVNTSEDEIPLRQNFEKPVDEQWATINPQGGMTWEEKSIGTNNVIYYNAYNNPLIGDRGWFVSPVLDFSEATEASLYFDLSYAHRGNRLDRLRVMTSLDCGVTYTDTLLNEVGSLLSNGHTSTASWQPDTLDWRSRRLSLSSLAGKENVRVAFAFTSRNGNNIYLDNIEFFLSSGPLKTDAILAVYPVPAKPDETLLVTFGLPEKGPVEIDIVDVTGKVIISKTPSNILNQSFEILLENVSAGVYLLRAKTGDAIYTRRIMVVK